ncbi:MAG: M23 family metallopeptidase [Anaerolineae bacterium]
MPSVLERLFLPSRLRRFLSPLFLLIVLVGCGSGRSRIVPTLIPVAVLPQTPTLTTAPRTTPEDVTADIIVGGALTGTDEAADSPPTPVGTGVRPADVRQVFVPDTGLADSPERRPPPFPVPLSLHPDDHYWLARPIASGRRNYELDWYPFGNDVQIPELAPYRIHHGADFPNDPGTPVHAAGSGTVIHASPLPSPNNGLNYYGNTIIIRHDWQWLGQDVYTLYAHTLERFVEVGDHVETGQLLAGVGSSGDVSGPHLHLEVRVGGNTYADTRNPALWLVPFEGWGTLAGRFVDRRGRMITEAEVTVLPVNGGAPVRIQRTYHASVRSDEVWRENFAVGDLPAGQYLLRIMVDDITYQRQVEVFPGRTTFEIISTHFDFVPTPMPTPSPTLAVTGTLTTAVPLETPQS